MSKPLTVHAVQTRGQSPATPEPQAAVHSLHDLPKRKHTTVKSEQPQEPQSPQTMKRGT